MKNLVILAFMFFVAKNTIAQNWDQIIKTASNSREANSGVVRQAFDEFGYSVSIDGNYAAIGLLGGLPTQALYDSGAVIIFKYTSSGWKQIKKLESMDPLGNDNFGTSVSISGSTVVVGAERASGMDAAGVQRPQIGAAYIFSKDEGGIDNWGQVKKIVAADRAYLDGFGYSVAIDGSSIVVGAPHKDTDGNNVNPLLSTGAAYIFSKDQGGLNNWGQVKELLAPDRNAYDIFGWKVGISGTTIVVGAAGQSYNAVDADSLLNAGAAYIFSKTQGGTNNWGQVKKIVASDRKARDGFGLNLDVDGSTIIVSSSDGYYNSGPNVTNTEGAVYVFNKDEGGINNWGEVKKIVGAASNPYRRFGFYPTISGNTIVVGASNFPVQGNAIYIFNKDQGGVNNWGEVKKIVTTSLNDEPPLSLAISGNTLLVGANWDDEDVNGENPLENAGAAYIFNKDEGSANNWGQFQKITAEEKIAQNYGFSVAIDGNYAIVGAYNDEPHTSGNAPKAAGSAYILYNNKGVWTEVKKILASDKTANDNFGYAVSISGSNVIISAPNQATDATGTNTKDFAGAAYIFNKDEGGADNWGQVKKIVASDRTFNDYFGWSVSISGDYVVVGAYQEDEDASGFNLLKEAGSAYIFSKDQNGLNSWGQVKKIVASDRSLGDNFGNAVAINGTTVVVGAWKDDKDADGANTMADAGSAYIFEKDQGGADGWGQVKKIVAVDRTVGDNFGNAVATSNNTIVIGAPLQDKDATGANTLSGAGAAYVFNKDEGGVNTWGQVKKVVAADRVASDIFGYSVAIDGTTLIVGAPFQDKDAEGLSTLLSAGAAYIFSKDEGGLNIWGQVKKLVASDRDGSDYFGWYVAISGTTALVGAVNEDENADAARNISNSGSAYFYKNCSGLIIASNKSVSISNQPNAAKDYYDNNCNLLATVQPVTGNNVITGHTRVNVWLETMQPVDYVKRHFEIAPALVNNSTKGRVTLYFTQQDFNDFNAINIIKLPTNNADVNGRANLLIEKRSGVSSDGSGLPGTYTGTTSTIDPDDADIIFNTTKNRWEVSFNVIGFSGFFAKTTLGPLPVKWLNISAVLNANNQATITWKLTENDVQNYELESSTDGSNFKNVTILSSKGDGTNTYVYTDKQLVNGTVFYRVKENSKNGSYSYSEIVKLNASSLSILNLYPNPVQNRLMIRGAKKGETLLLIDVAGKVLQKVLVSQNECSLDMKGYSSGMYFIKNTEGKLYKIIKQ